MLECLLMMLATRFKDLLWLIWRSGSEVGLPRLSCGSLPQDFCQSFVSSSHETLHGPDFFLVQDKEFFLNFKVLEDSSCLVPVCQK